MELQLNIYKNSKEIEKTYTCQEFDLMFGTCENIIALMDLDFLNEKDDTQLAISATKIVRGSLDEVKDLLKEVFPELTDDELKRTKLKELVTLVIELVKFTFSGITNIGKKK